MNKDTIGKIEKAIVKYPIDADTIVILAHIFGFLAANDLSYDEIIKRAFEENYADGTRIIKELGLRPPANGAVFLWSEDDLINLLKGLAGD